ncbi:MAG: hypothetical protein WAZ77_14545 [Candidatus Nitrosopolaris sp.]
MSRSDDSRISRIEVCDACQTKSYWNTRPSSIRCLLHYLPKENNIQMPEKNKIEEKAERAIATADKLPRSDVG